MGGHKVHLCCGKVGESKKLNPDKASRGANKKYFSETGSYVDKVFLAKGTHVIELYADRINPADPVGLSISRLELQRK